jgi:uncharacterized protein (TIGR02246 family)
MQRTMDDEASIRALRLAWNAAIARGDVEGAVGPIPHDAILLPAGGTPLIGRAAIRRAWRGLLTGANPQFVRTPQTLTLAPDAMIAAEQGAWHGGGQAGRYLAEWRRTPEGWTCAREMFVEGGDAAVSGAAS